MEENQQPTTMTKNEPKKLTYDNPFFESIFTNVYNKKRNAMIIVCGNVGTGKSYVALKIAEALDSSFNAENLKDRLVLEPKQFMEMIVRKKNKLKRGDAIIIDEASTQMYNRQWASVNNQMINFIITTFRHRGLICIMTVPYMDFLDSNVRRLFDYFVETKKIDFNVKQTKAKVYQLSYNKMKADKPYRKYFRMKTPGGERQRIDFFWFDKVNDELGDKYEEYATEFKNMIAQEALDKALLSERKEENKEVNVDEIVDKILADKKRYFKMCGSRVTVNQSIIEYDFNVGGGLSKRIKALVQVKAQESNLINV